MDLRSASGCINATASWTSSPVWTGSREMAIIPTSIRDRSSTSLISASRCRPALRMCSTASASSWSMAEEISRSWPNPRMAFSGVRSSWLMRDRNSLFAMLARVASSLASSASRCASFHCRSPCSLVLQQQAALQGQAGDRPHVPQQADLFVPEEGRVAAGPDHQPATARAQGDGLSRGPAVRVALLAQLQGRAGRRRLPVGGSDTGLRIHEHRAGAVLVDPQPRATSSCGQAPATGTTLELGEESDPNGRAAREAIPLGPGRGRLVVWTSRYTPFFGHEEVSLLRNMGAIASLALERCQLLEDERARRTAVEGSAA